MEIPGVSNNTTGTLELNTTSVWQATDKKKKKKKKAPAPANLNK